MRPFAFVLVLASLLTAASAPPRRAPGFSLPDVDFQQHDLYDYRGKVVLIDFMQTKCAHCQLLTGVISKLEAKYGSKLQVLSVVVPPDTKTDVTAYINRFNVKNPMLFDSGQVTASYLRISPSNPQVHFPSLFVIDPNGVIRNELTFVDEAKKADFEEPALSGLIDQALGKK